MDERVFQYKVGQPIPEWDLRHRLATERPVGPDCKDTATIFRINSTYMDVTDQPYMTRQLVAAGTLACGATTGAITWALIEIANSSKEFNFSDFLFLLFIFSSSAIFAYTGIRNGRDEFFSLTHRPIRFNRIEKKIYTIRRRRFSAKLGEGDITWEVPWNSESIFCIHKNKKSIDESYHIRHYTLDSAGNVLRAFAIGREWEGTENLEGLLSQWNYWCEYMNSGPATLPKPPLFFCEFEDVRESFFFCMYELGFNVPPILRLLMMPYTLIMTVIRSLALASCRAPVWPDTVLKLSRVEQDDPYDEPRDDTPTGWADTIMARQYDGYPTDPKRKMERWQGEPDGAKNAALWAQDIPAAMAHVGADTAAAKLTKTS